MSPEEVHEVVRNAHCNACKADATNLCNCVCYKCDVAYFLRNLYAAIFRREPTSFLK